MWRSPPPLGKKASPAVYCTRASPASVCRRLVSVPAGSLIQMKKPPSGLLISTSVPFNISQSPRSMASRLSRYTLTSTLTCSAMLSRMYQVDTREVKGATPPLLAQRGQLLAQDRDDQPVAIHGHVHNLGPVPPDRVQRPREGGRFRDHDVAHVEESAEGQRQRMARAVGDDDVLRLDLEPF